MILSGGGTAGHIYPALAVADELRRRGHSLTYVGTPTGPEAQLAPAAGLEFIGVAAAGFDRARPQTLVTSSLQILRSAARVRRLITRVGADAVVGFGGYVAIPVGWAATRAGIPLAIHEQNSIMGMTNRFLAKRAQFIALTYPDTVDAARAVAPGTARVEFTGNPVRAEVIAGDAAAARERFGLADPAATTDATILTVFGGSRGARHLNTAISGLAARLLTEHPGLEIVHAAGPAEYDSVLAAREQLSDILRARWHVVDYLQDMGDVLAATDVACTRAGATTIAELTAAGVPAVLVPYPYATDDHQTGNARALVAAGGARLIPDAELDTDALWDVLHQLVTDADLRATMGASARKLGRVDAAARLADGIEHMIQER
ncbi:MAG: undecaprenyldiphospho-muramoylpentapeptide beta-N-acetylglucosaminyltransferase [Actinomycetes bacterium]|jgi:UDP-N-acetylglucosamine--N-acetylmuramyl-(pentapeptide) pyrophosphoryl-undecaprenol N-acetylglucosamine transferase|nr:undecaprenyldiphospho-muramoylpentapeptide beta-N-acetylglucosaminyltransferase [Actinomycetes bacterium]